MTRVRAVRVGVEKRLLEQIARQVFEVRGVVNLLETGA